MMNQQLVDYARQQMQAGVSKEAVRKALGEAGWPAADIEDSFKAAGPAAQPAATSPAGQGMVNPAVAMGGFDVASKTSAGMSSSDKFFSKPAGAEMRKDDEHPAAKKFMATMIAMGAVILLLAGALAFVYFNLNSQLTAARSGNPDELASVQGQLAELRAQNKELAENSGAMAAENQALLSELGFFVPAASTGSTTPVSAIIRGTLSGSASSTFMLTTPHDLKVLVANSKDAKVAAALAPLASGTSTITLAGTHQPGSLNLTVTAVNGTPL